MSFTIKVIPQGDFCWGELNFSFKAPFILWITQRCCCARAWLLDLHTPCFFYKCFLTSLSRSECRSSCFCHGVVEVSRQRGFLINPSTPRTKDATEGGTCHPTDMKGCSDAFPLICTSLRDGDWMLFAKPWLTAAVLSLTSFLLSLSFCNNHLIDACGDLGAHSRKVVLFLTPYWTISAAFLYAGKQK